MKAMLLAAGLGSRLRPLTDQTPKPLLPVGGRPLIAYTLLLLKKYGIHEVIINVHHLGEQIIQAVGNGDRMGMRITYSEEASLLGTAGAIKKVQAQLEDAPFLIINGDILIDLDLDAVAAFHRQCGGMATLVLRASEDAEQFGVLEIDRACRIRNILGKTPWNKADARAMMFTGVHLASPRILDFLPREGSITDVYVEMLQREEALYGYLAEGYFCDLGTPERYYRANRDMTQGRVCLKHLRNVPPEAFTNVPTGW